MRSKRRQSDEISMSVLEEEKNGGELSVSPIIREEENEACEAKQF